MKKFINLRFSIDLVGVLCSVSPTIKLHIECSINYYLFPEQNVEYLFWTSKPEIFLIMVCLVQIRSKIKSKVPTYKYNLQSFSIKNITNKSSNLNIDLRLSVVSVGFLSSFLLNISTSLEEANNCGRDNVEERGGPYDYIYLHYNYTNHMRFYYKNKYLLKERLSTLHADTSVHVCVLFLLNIVDIRMPMSIWCIRIKKKIKIKPVAITTICYKQSPSQMVTF
ncbi:hypothetical protein AGLY_006992 [Aphis glycines]|uniref:Uncharacterized protein n=1 Tax=Aphis glycines TaxID=307491 RepID=A0A6G0TPB8_APHGL|nr:hypothetical protein AGLY_006992 [Aphis glycines]